MRMLLLMAGYHKEPIATSSVIKRCNFLIELDKLHSQNLGDDWAGGQRYGLSRGLYFYLFFFIIIIIFFILFIFFLFLFFFTTCSLNICSIGASHASYPSPRRI